MSQHKQCRDHSHTGWCKIIRIKSCEHCEFNFQDASWLVSELNTVMNKINIEFNFTNCDVVGGEVSSSPVLIISNIILTFVIIASMIILLLD